MTDRSHRIAPDRSFFCIGQCKRDGSGGGTIFDAEFAQDAFDVLEDRPGTCAEDHADFFKSYVIGGATRGGSSNYTGDLSGTGNCWTMSTVKLELKINGQVIGSTVFQLK
jgi:hypothetical protein